MILAFLRALRARRRHPLHGVPRDLPPHLMRDIGLPPWPERLRLPPGYFN